MRSFFSFLLCLAFAANGFSQNLPLAKERTYQTNIFNDAGAQDIAWDKNSKHLFSINASLNMLEVYDLIDIAKPFKMASIDLSTVISRPTSIASFNGLVAVTGIGTSPQGSGKVLYFDNNGLLLKQFSVGPMPKMVNFTPGGNHCLIVNEGIPTDDYTIDPAGSISIINISIGINNVTQSGVITIPFTPLDSITINPLVLTYGNNNQQLVSQDLEPEYISGNNSGTKAYVSLQENNAVMIIDIQSSSIDTVIGLGYLDRSIAGNGLDASDVNTAIDIKTYDRLFALYQPHAMEAFEVGGNQYLLSTNEGAPRQNTAYDEVNIVSSTILHPGKFSNISTLINSNNLGNLEVTRELGDNDGDGLFDSIYTFGTRSFSIWDENLQLLWDSGDEFEQIIALAHPNDFNSNNDDNNSFKSQSDNLGPEPKAAAIGEVDGTLYAFIGMEKMGGFMVYDISDPLNPQFELYELNRDFSLAASDPDVGDLGIESIVFVPSTQSPTDFALVIVASPASGTFTIYQIGQGIGLTELEDAQFLKAFPNPTTGNLELNNYGDYKILDASGRLVQSLKNVNSLDLANEPEGLYIIKNNKGDVIRVIRQD